mmetsp:Transcript_8479/g.18652  ORF Transcript_8479/g.18652 Transcript_8479/m.18652 type:complete len:254 (+) Transcript_8479:458-1219(+)
MSLGLHVAAHVGEGGVELAGVGVGDHAGNDGVVGARGGAKAVGVGGIEDEAPAAVLEGEAAVLGDQSRAESGIVAVDEAHRHPFSVHYLKADGPRPLRGNSPARGPLRIEKVPRPCPNPLLVQQRGHARRRLSVWVGHEGLRVGEAQAHHFHRGVEGFAGGAIFRGGDPARSFELRQALKSDQGRRSLAVGGALPQPFPAIIGTDRFGKGAAMVAEIVGSQESSFLPDDVDDLASDGRMFVEPLPRPPAPEET